MARRNVFFLLMRDYYTRTLKRIIYLRPTTAYVRQRPSVPLYGIKRTKAVNGGPRSPLRHSFDLLIKPRLLVVRAPRWILKMNFHIRERAHPSAG